MTLGECDRKLESLGYPLDRIPGVGAIYKPVVIDETTVYTAGSVPFDGDQLIFPGKVASIVSIEQAGKAAALCAANILESLSQGSICREFNSSVNLSMNTRRPSLQDRDQSAPT